MFNSYSNIHTYVYINFISSCIKGKCVHIEHVYAYLIRNVYPCLCTDFIHMIIVNPIHPLLICDQGRFLCGVGVFTREVLAMTRRAPRSGAMQSRVHTGCFRHDPGARPLRCHAVTCSHGMFSP